VISQKPRIGKGVFFLTPIDWQHFDVMKAAVQEMISKDVTVRKEGVWVVLGVKAFKKKKPIAIGRGYFDRLIT